MKSKVFNGRATSAVIGLLAALSSGVTQAGEAAEATGLADYMAGKGDAQILKDFGIKWGGWLQSSVTYNGNSNPDKFNGPVTFGDRSSELQVNQLYLFLQKAVNTSGDEWDWGGRFDIMYGTDSIFTQAYGVPATDPRTGRLLNRGHWDLHLTSFDDRFYGLALPQAYGELNIPVGNGLNIKAGHFYTPIGYEVVTAPDNFFFTKPYTFQYGEPFTHTGILGTYTINDNWSAMAGAVTGSATGGWDGNWDQQLGNWDFIGGGTWTSDDKNYSLNLTSTAGAQSEHSSNTWALYSLVGKANFLDNTLHYIIQHDHGFANNVITSNTSRNGGKNEDARWYGINQYLLYDIAEDWGVGLRTEWFRDNNGFRVAGPARCSASLNADASGVVSPYACQGNYGAYPWAGSNYYEITAGLTYKPVKWITVRPNVRYDWTDKIKIFDSGKRTDQILFSTDLVISF
jgi:hypothetical protein